MPSPIAHISVSYAIYRLNRGKLPAIKDRKRPALLILCVSLLAAMAPDVDAVIGILFGDLGRFHNNSTHSLVVGAAFAIGLAGAMWIFGQKKFSTWFTIAIMNYSFHVLMDMVTYQSRGVMLFWPLSLNRIEVPFSLFYGVRWSEGVISLSHLWTVASELVFLAGILALIRGMEMLNKRAHPRNP